MSDPMDHEAVQDLLGPYSLDAVDGEERHFVEEHLATCPRCRAELDAYQEVAAALGNSTSQAPEHLWDRIVGEMHAPWETTPETPELPATLRARLTRPEGTAPVGEEGEDVAAIHRIEPEAGEGSPGARRRARRRTRVLVGVAAAAVLVAAALGVEVGRLNSQVSQQQSALHAVGVRQAAIGALADPAASTASLTAPEGRQVAQVAVVDGRGYLVAKDMASLPGDETYQLWGLIAGQPISLGLLGAHPRYAAFSAGSLRPSEVMLTIEPAGGVATPDRAPIAKGHLS